jgi:hypothetical protein
VGVYSANKSSAAGPCVRGSSSPYSNPENLACDVHRFGTMQTLSASSWRLYRPNRPEREANSHVERSTFRTILLSSAPSRQNSKARTKRFERVYRLLFPSLHRRYCVIVAGGAFLRRFALAERSAIPPCLDCIPSPCFRELYRRV